MTTSSLLSVINSIQGKIDGVGLVSQLSSIATIQTERTAHDPMPTLWRTSSSKLWERTQMPSMQQGSEPTSSSLHRRSTPAGSQSHSRRTPKSKLLQANSMGLTPSVFPALSFINSVKLKTSSDFTVLHKPKSGIKEPYG